MNLSCCGTIWMGARRRQSLPHHRRQRLIWALADVVFQSAGGSKMVVIGCWTKRLIGWAPEIPHRCRYLSLSCLALKQTKFCRIWGFCCAFGHFLDVDKIMCASNNPGSGVFSFVFAGLVWTSKEVMLVYENTQIALKPKSLLVSKYASKQYHGWRFLCRKTSLGHDFSDPKIIWLGSMKEFNSQVFTHQHLKQVETDPIIPFSIISGARRVCFHVVWMSLLLNA